MSRSRAVTSRWLGGRPHILDINVYNIHKPRGSVLCIMHKTQSLISSVIAKKLWEISRAAESQVGTIAKMAIRKDLDYSQRIQAGRTRQSQEPAPTLTPSRVSCDLASCTDRPRLSLLLKAERPLKHRDACGPGHAAAALRLDPLCGHKLRSGEQRLLGFLMVAVAIGVEPIVWHKLNGRPDGVLAVDRQGLRLDSVSRLGQALDGLRPSPDPGGSDTVEEFKSPSSLDMNSEPAEYSGTLK